MATTGYEPRRVAFAHGHRFHKVFRNLFPEDFNQIAEIVAWEITTRQIDMKEAYRLASRIFREAERSYGIGRRVEALPEDLDRFETKPIITARNTRFGNGLKKGVPQGTRFTTDTPCGVSGCPETSAYNDNRLGRLCRHHMSVVNTRRRRGWADPYKDLANARRNRRKPMVYCGVPGCSIEALHYDCKFEKICNRHAIMRNNRVRAGWADPYVGFVSGHEKLAIFVPERNSAFWAKVRLGVTDAEWIAMWLWANGDSPAIAPGILAKAKAAALD